LAECLHAFDLHELMILDISRGQQKKHADAQVTQQDHVLKTGQHLLTMLNHSALTLQRCHPASLRGRTFLMSPRARRWGSLDVLGARVAGGLPLGNKGLD